MRVLATILAALFPTVAAAGGMTAFGSHAVTAAAVPKYVDTYYIQPDQQSLTWVEEFEASPWGSIGDIPAATDLEQQYQWVCDNRATHNIKAVVAMGDLVRNGSNANNWPVVNDAVTILDGCNVPFILPVGNHELDDGTTNPQNPEDPGDATQYHVNQGQDVMDAKGWFSGSRAQRPDWVDCITDADGDGTCDTDTYLENETTYASRSFWVPVPPLNIMAPEWGYSIKISKASWTGPASPAVAWVEGLVDTHQNDYWLHVSHAGPCDTPHNCDLTPRDLGRNHGAMGGDWSSTIEALGPNVVGFLNGHWNGGAPGGCHGGGGVYATGTRGDGSTWLAGGFDFNCGVRLDPQVLAGTTNWCPDDGFGAPAVGCVAQGADCRDCDVNSYTWSGWLRIKRETGQICVDTIRVIDVDSNDDGTPDSGAATILTTIEQDRGGTWSHPDAANPEATELCTVGTDPGDGDTGPVTGCPNMGETCITITALP